MRCSKFCFIILNLCFILSPIYAETDKNKSAKVGVFKQDQAVEIKLTSHTMVFVFLAKTRKCQSTESSKISSVEETTVSVSTGP